MKHSYNISGMTCQSCLGKVTDALTALKSVVKVDVELEKSQAEIVMEQHVPIAKLQEAVSKAGDYSIKEKSDHHSEMATDITADEEENYSYRPLLLVLGFILLIVLIHEYNAGAFDWMRAMQHYMGGFFIAFSFFKLLDLKGFAYSYLSYDIVTKKWLGWGFVYPFVELLLGIFFLTSFQLKYTLIATIVVMGISSIGVIRAVLDKQRIKCACLGTGFNLPMSTVTIIEDLGMVIMAVIGLLSVT